MDIKDIIRWVIGIIILIILIKKVLIPILFS